MGIALFNRMQFVVGGDEQSPALLILSGVPHVRVSAWSAAVLDLHQ